MTIPTSSHTPNRIQFVTPSSVIRYRHESRPRIGISESFLVRLKKTSRTDMMTKKIIGILCENAPSIDSPSFGVIVIRSL